MDAVVRSGAPQPVLRLLNPAGMLANLWSHRTLIRQLARRDILGRYRAAQLGLLWSVLTPLILLGVYTFIFAVVLGTKWGVNANETRGEFAITMFCGLLFYNLFAEVVNRAPYMVVAVPNYVKRVVFPLEVFAVSGLLSAMFNLLVGYGVWLIGRLLLLHSLPPWTAVYLPLLLVPLCLTTAGLAWLLASLGVFVRDVSYVVAVIVQILFFLTPIFYRIEQIPARFRWIMGINPLSHVVEDARRVLMWGLPPEWPWWVGTTAGAAVLAVLGYAFFMKSKRAFADVI